MALLQNEEYVYVVLQSQDLAENFVVLLVVLLEESYEQ